MLVVRRVGTDGKVDGLQDGVSISKKKEKEPRLQWWRGQIWGLEVYSLGRMHLGTTHTWRGCLHVHMLALLSYYLSHPFLFSGSFLTRRLQLVKT